MSQHPKLKPETAPLAKPYRHQESGQTVAYEQDGHLYTATGIYIGQKQAEKQEKK